MRFFNKIISVILSVVTVVTMMLTLSLSTNATTYLISKNGSLDIYDSVDYYFNISTTRKIKLDIKASDYLNCYISIANDNYWGYDTVLCDNVSLKTYCKTKTFKAGKYHIKLSNMNYYDDNKITFSIKISDVTTFSTGIKFKTNARTIALGKSSTIEYTLSPSGSFAKSISWTSTNKKVAVVNKNGVVTAKGYGECYVLAKLSNGKKAKCKITVKSGKIIYVFNNLKRSFPLINGTKNLTWSSSDRSTAKVSNNKIKGLKEGQTLFTAKYRNVKYFITVCVVDYDSFYDYCVYCLKENLKDPESLQIHHVYRGYDLYGKPTIVLDQSARNGYGGMVRDYFVGYEFYDTTSKSIYFNGDFYDYLPYLNGKTQIK